MSVDIEPDLNRVFQRSVGAMADRLRRTAEDIERHGERVGTDLRDLAPDYLGAARNIVRDVQSLMGNLNLDAVLHAATDVDRYVREHEVAEETPAPDTVYRLHAEKRRPLPGDSRHEVVTAVGTYEHVKGGIEFTALNGEVQRFLYDEWRTDWEVVS